MVQIAKLSADLYANTSRFEQGLKRGSQSLRGFDGSVNNSREVLRKYQTAIFSIGTAYAALSAGRNLVNTALQLEALNSKMITAVGATGDVAGELERLKKEANDLGVNFQTSANNFASFAAAARLAGIDMSDVRDVFTEVSKAGVALKLNNEQMGGTFTALTQIASKGVVSMEELRQQLGERLPVAIAAMAEGLGITQAELVDLVSSGALPAAEGLRGLADGFRNNADLAAAFAQAADGTQAQINRLNNKVFELKTELIQNTDIIPLFNTALDDMGEIISNEDFQEGLRLIVKSLAAIAKVALMAADGVGIVANAIGDLSEKLSRNRELRDQFLSGDITSDEYRALTSLPTDREIKRETKKIEETLDKEISDLKKYAESKGKQLTQTETGGFVVSDIPQRPKTTTNIDGKADKDELKKQLKSEKEAAKEAEQQMKDYTDSIQVLQQRQRDYADEAGDSLFQLARGYESLRDVALRALDDILRSMFRLSMGGTSTGGIFGDIGGAIFGGLFGGGATTPVQAASMSKPSLATGIANVPYDMPAMLHKGESVIPAQQAKKMGSGGGSVYNIDARGAENGVEQKIRSVLMEVEQLRKDVPNISISSVKNANNRNLGFLS